MTRISANYECPRCGYVTKLKGDIEKHLYKLKKPCCATVRDIVLTEEDKQKILTNRVLVPKEQATHSTTAIQNTYNQTINNYNQMIGYVNKLDVVDKITKYSDFKKQPLMGFDEQIERKFSDIVERLENNAYKDFTLPSKEIINLIDDLTRTENIQTLNVIHDTVSDRIKMFNAGEWNSMLFDKGIDEVVLKLKDIYFDYYENYLLRRLYQASAYEKQCLTERIKSYYSFIVSFDLDPYVDGISDGDILDTEATTNTLSDTYYSIYVEIRDCIPNREVKKTRAQVANIIKNNNKANVMKLNNDFLTLMNAEETFKQMVLDKLQKLTL